MSNDKHNDSDPVARDGEVRFWKEAGKPRAVNQAPPQRIRFRRVTLGLLAGAGLLTGGGWGLDFHSRRVAAPYPVETVTHHQRELSAELTSLEQGLDNLRDTFFELGQVELEARDVCALPSRPDVSFFSDGGVHFTQVEGFAGHAGSLPLVESWSGARSCLLEARQLSSSYQEIAHRMGINAEAWAHVPSRHPLEEGRRTSRFGWRKDPFSGRLAWHHGVDWSAPRGTPVYSPADGKVIRSEWVSGYGRLVEIDHGQGLTTRYGHNSRLAVRGGDRVERGAIIAYVGSTGRASAPHLHYEVRLNGKSVNPEPFLLPLAAPIRVASAE